MKLLPLLAFAFVGSFGLTQESVSTSLLSIEDVRSSSWQLYVDAPSFKIEYRFEDCDPTQGMDRETIILRFTNTSSDKIELAWRIDLYYGDECNTCAYPEEYGFSLSLNPNEIIEGDCNVQGTKLKLFSKFIDAAYSGGMPLDNFQLNNLTKIILP